MSTGKGTEPIEHVTDCVRVSGRHVERCPLWQVVRFDEPKIGFNDVLDVHEVTFCREVADGETRLLLACLDARDLRRKGRQCEALVLTRTRVIERACHDEPRTSDRKS